MAHQKSADPNVFILPDLGEGVHEAELIKWRVSIGQTVAEHDIPSTQELAPGMYSVVLRQGRESVVLRLLRLR
mgnify:CR=1 FL=1